MKSIRLLLAFVICSSCGTFPIQREKYDFTDNENVVPKIVFIGAYDSRVQLGAVETHRTETTYSYQPLYTTRGLAGGFVYPQTNTVRTGEIAPNDIIKSVASGVSEVFESKQYFTDESSTAPLEIRNEIGMEWFASHGSYRGYLISIEVKDAKIDLAKARQTMGIATIALIFGIMSPILCFTTAPCLLALPALETEVTGEGECIVHGYNIDTKEYIKRSIVKETIGQREQGFYDVEQLYKLVADELGRRLGMRAGQKIMESIRNAEKAREG